MKIIDVARKYLNQKEEARNVFNIDTPLARLVKQAGQKNGEAWCCYFAEGVCVEAYPEKREILTTLFSASTIKTFENFRAAGFVISPVPVLGAIVIWQRWQDGVKTWKGHAGIVSKVVTATRVFFSIEGNTNSAGSREGDSVQEKERLITHRETGLNVLGFINLQYE